MEEEEQEQVYNFEGSDGQKYSAKQSELPELVEQAKAAGVELKGVMSKEESTAARDDDYWTWDNAKAGVRGIWDDPTGEHGALAYMGLNLASGLGTAAGVVGRGMVKGATDVGFGLARGVARGVESLVGADGHAVSGFLGDWHESFNEIADTLTPDVFEKRGMYDGIEGAHETMGAINSFAESVFAMKGMGRAAKGVGALAGGRKAAAIGQAVMAAGMGGNTYAEMAEDPNGPGGWRQELAAAGAGAITATTFGVLGPWKKMNMALPKPFELLTKAEVVKRFALEAAKSGAMMAIEEAGKLGMERLATVGTDQRWNPMTLSQVIKSVRSQFMVGSGFHAVNALGKSGAWLAWRADRKAGEGALTFQVEQNRKHYAPIMDRQARLALQAREVAARDPGAKWLEATTPGAEGTENVKAVAKDGSVQFDDGSVWRMGADGRATITVADGTILDARTGAVEGYRANREAAAPRDAEGNELPKEETRAENAALFLDALERGELQTVAEPLEGLQITETSYKQGTVLDGEWDQAKAPPVIVWVGNDGTRELITGRSRAAAAAAAGVKEIKAVEIHERDWTRQQAESLDAVENMREGRGTREEIARGVEALGIRSVEDCDRYEIVPERPVLDAITVLNEGSEALRSAATEGTVGRAWAAECAERLGKKSLGEASERAQATALDMIAGKLPPEEAGAAMEAIAELAARKPDYTDREAADAIRAARERAVGRVAVDADSEMVEMPDGTIKSVAEAKAEGAAEAQEAAAEGKSLESGWRATAPANTGGPAGTAMDKAAEPTVKADGSVGCVRFEGAKATRTRSEDGREIVLIEGMTGEEMMRPENRDAAVQFVTRLKEMAGDVDLVFADVSAADAAEALLMAARVRARASSVSGDTIAGSGDLVTAGQRLVDGLFGEKSGVRVRTGTREEAEAALRAAGEAKPIKDAEGQVQGYYDRGKGEVVLFEGADAGTLAHEIGWHAVRHWAERNSPDLLLKMNRYAARAPRELKAAIKEAYGDFKGDALMDEIGAGRFERAMGERFQKLLAKSPEVRGWWRKVLHALARAWKGMARTVGGNRVDLKKIEKMDPEEAIEALTAQMLEGRRLGEGGGAGKGIRPSIGGVKGASQMGIKGAGDAEAMEKAGKDREEIWRTTGWWRGKDGKWRVELPSLKMKGAKDIERALRDGGNETTLGKVIDAPDLFKAYPEMESLKIEFSPDVNVSAGAQYDKRSNTITVFNSGLETLADRPRRDQERYAEAQKRVLNEEYLKEVLKEYDDLQIEHGTLEEEREAEKYIMSRIDARIADMNAAIMRRVAEDTGPFSPWSMLVHEIEHAIQEREDFARGGSIDAIRHARSVVLEINRDIRAKMKEAGVQAWKDSKRERDWDAAQKELAGYKNDFELFRAFLEQADIPEEKRREYKTFLDGHERTWKGAMSRAYPGKDPQTVYESFAGEVEARNASRREAMTPEERAATPPWATEDVPEDRQIIRFSRALAPSALGDGKQKYYEVPFDKAVDKIVKNRKPVSDEHVFLSETPTALREIGIPALPVMMNQRHVLSCYYGKGEGVKAGNMHGLGDRLKSLPRALSRPMMVIANDSNPSSSVIAIVKMLDRDGHTVIAPVEINGIGRSNEGPITANVVKSAFGKRNIWSEKVAKALRDEVDGKVAVFYVDSNEARGIESRLAREAFDFGKSERQLLSVAKGTVHSVSDYGSPVKGVGAQKDSQQFKRWFADSKVVDENGEPLVVYRRDNEGFNVFDVNKTQQNDAGWLGKGFYFYGDRREAESATGYGKNLRKFYLKAENPYYITQEEYNRLVEADDPRVSAEFAERLTEEGYDSVYWNGDGRKEWMVLEPTQIKSATDNIGTFDPGNPDIRYARGGKRRDEVYDDVLRAVRAGGQRVAAGRSERTEAGFDAGANLYLEREGQVEKAPDGSMTLAYSEALRLYRALAANAHMPKILEKMPWLAGRGRDGRLRLNAAAFGIVDRSDMEAVKAGLKKDGMFLNEDPSWRLHNSYEEVKAMKELSEQALAEEMEGLAEARIKGKTSGGGRTAVNILAKEIGRIACELPTTAGAPQSLKDLRKLGMGISKELGDPKGELGKEAQEATRWWREQDPVRKDPTATKSEDIAESELWAEMFGMFLADPVGLEAHAPKVYAKMVEAIAGNEKLSEAWNGLRRTRDAEGPHERVMRDIERQWSVNEQQAYKELLSELDKPIGTWGKRTKARLMLELHSAEGPAVYWVTDAVRERLAELKRLKKAGKIDEKTYDALAGGAKRELEKMRVALLHKQRGGGTGRLYALDFASGVMADVARDGVDMGDLRRYMYAKSVRDGLHQKGKAAALGMDQREAQKVLEELEGRLGAEGWAKLETAAKRFQATREQHLLENEFVLEAFGRDLVNYWKMNASYVRSERTWTAEEVAAYEAARSDWMARHPGESTVIAEIEALMDMHVAKGSGTAGSSFLKPLVGSNKAVKDPIAATLENDLRIIEFAQRNHWACQLAESAKSLGMEGFAVMEDRGGGGKLRGSNRYGSVSFLKDGKRMTLVMPKVVAEGFEHDAKGVSKLVKLNRWASAILTQYSPRFALRNIWRNRASNANNIAWMGEGRLVTGMGMVGMRPVARLATFLLERAAAHLPDRFARNALMNVLYGSKTNVYWEAEATRLAKMMQDPQLLRRRAEEANSLMLQGKSAEAQRLWDDIQKCQEFMKLPIFAGVRKQIMGESGKTDLDELMRSLNLETNFDGTKLTGMGRVKRWMQRRAETVKRFNDFEEARVKLIALLAAQHEAELAQARGEAAPRSRDEITYQVATMSGSPRYENRGRAMNYIEFACGPFMNVGMKGAWRTVESMRYDPKSWWTKAAGRIAGRLATSVLWMGGGYKVLAEILRESAGDDEDKKKRVDAFERFGKRMAHALANVSDYRLRNYDIVPVGLYGKWSTLAISMPRGDEDRLLMPTVDLLANGLLGSEKAQEMGFALPTDLNYTATDAVQNTVLNSGLVPDLTRRGLLMSLFQDAIGPLVGWNPYNTFTQRTVYSEADFESRFADPGNMASKVGKQLWNDLGGQVVMPATTWDEDEGAYDDQGQWALSGAEEGEAGCMPIGGKTIFRALHSIPFLSAAASGLITFQNGGNERIARRLEKYRRDDGAPLRAAAQRVADEVIEAVRANGEDFDYSEMLAARVSELGLPEEDAEIIEGLAFKKVQGIAAKMGSEFDPIGKTLRKMSNDEKMYRRAKRQVEAEGWDGDFD